MSGLLDLRAGPVEIVEAVLKGEVSASLAHSTIREAKGDGEAATMAVRDAVAAARAEGKTKATPKHFREKKPSAGSSIALVRRVLETAETFQPKDHDDCPLVMTEVGMILIKIDIGDWIEIKAALGIVEKVNA